MELGEGVRSYKRTSSEQREMVYDILSNTKRPCNEVVLSSESMPSEIVIDSAQNSSLPSYMASKQGPLYFIPGAFHQKLLIDS